MNIQTQGLRTALQRLQTDITQAASTSVAQAVKAAEASAKATTLFHDKSGATRASIKGTVEGSTGFVVAGGAAKFLEYGTKPHVIVPKNGKFLRFSVAGETVYAGRVNHPGTAPRPFMQQAARAGEVVMHATAAAMLDAALSRFNS